MCLGKIFSRGQKWIFPGATKRILGGSPKLVKFRIMHWKLRNQPFLLKINKKMSNFKMQGDLCPSSVTRGEVDRARFNNRPSRLKLRALKFKGSLTNWYA